MCPKQVSFVSSLKYVWVCWLIDWKRLVYLWHISYKLACSGANKAVRTGSTSFTLSTDF